MRFTGDIEQKDRVGFYTGVFAEKAISDFLGVQGELLYTQMGYRFKAGGDSYGLNTDYLALPILAKLYVWRGLSLDLGPQFGYRLSAKGAGRNSGDDMDACRLKDFDTPFAAGLSYKLCGKIDLSVRYNIGLTGIDKSSADGKNKNAAHAFGAGYRF